MYKNKKIILIAPAFNEEEKIKYVVERSLSSPVDKILVVDDGSIDQTAQVAKDAGAEVLSLGAVKGVGYAIREGIEQAAREGFDITVIIAGNNKDEPNEIPKLLDPIIDEGVDFVMGSRFLSGGTYGGDMPAYRKLSTKLHPFLLGLMCGKSITESTNGFRAFKTSIVSDERINLNQKWLDHYELEVYFLMKVLKLNFNYREVPVTKIYPPKKIGYTKMRPVIDWWKMLRPIFIIGFGLKK